MRRQLVKIVLGISVLLVLFFLIRFFRMGFWQIFALLGTFNVLMIFWHFIRAKIKPTPLRFIWNIVKDLGILFMILYFYSLLFQFLSGFWGFVLGCVIVAGVIIIRRREKWLKVKYTIESKIWGQPLKDLPKDYWKKS